MLAVMWGSENFQHHDILAQNKVEPRMILQREEKTGHQAAIFSGFQLLPF